MELLLITVKNVKELKRYTAYDEIFVKFECDSNCWNMKEHKTTTLSLKDYNEMLEKGYYYG